jgi:hypothetical protein
MPNKQENKEKTVFGFFFFLLFIFGLVQIRVTKIIFRGLRHFWEIPSVFCLRTGFSKALPVNRCSFRLIRAIAVRAGTTDSRRTGFLALARTRRMAGSMILTALKTKTGRLKSYVLNPGK